ncbi:MAG: hypothetical protein FWD11_12015, partial [Micrococcales bacterium]|nr:hypothetical protein [Micrococcales bacterium]
DQPVGRDVRNTVDQPTRRLVHRCHVTRINHLSNTDRGIGERANALLKGYKVLDKVTFSPERVIAVAAAVLVFVHMTCPSAHSW